MFRINHRQETALSLLVTVEFQSRLLLRLRRYLPHATGSLSEADLIQLITSGVRNAASYDVRGERDVSIYIGLMLTLGPEFDKSLDWVNEVLTDVTLRPSEKVHRLFQSALRNNQSTATPERGGTRESD